MSRAIDRFTNMVRQHSELEARDVAKPRTGVISSYDPVKHAVKVMLQPEGVEAPGWIPLGAIGVGNLFGIVSGPNIGDPVQVVFSEGDNKAPRIISRFFSTVNMPPIVQSGETFIVHALGAFIKFTNDGKVTIHDSAGSSLVMSADGTGSMTFANGLTVNANTKIVGTLNVTQNITGQQDIQDNAATQPDTMATMRTIYNGHTHPVNGIQTGSSNIGTAAPTQKE